MLKYDKNLYNDFSTIIGKTKDNIMKKGKANHHNSQGKYYSFGNKGAFKLIGNSSVGQYTQKEVKAKRNMDVLIGVADKAEKLCACHIYESVEAIGKVVRNISKLLSPLINVAFQMQSKLRSVNFQEVATTPSGMWQSSVCINARTARYHTEIATFRMV